MRVNLGRLCGLALVLVLLGACAVQSSNVAGGAGTQAPFIPVLAASELEVGQNRLPLGIIRDGQPINDPNLQPQLKFFYLDGENKAEPLSESSAVYRGQGLPIGLYVAYPQLDRAGAWAVEVSIPGPEGAQQSSRLRLDVLEKGKTPAIGSPAIPSQNLTVKHNPDLKQITSDGAPDPDLYQLSVADALAAKQPFVVMFATPGFCKTAVCSPNMDVLKQLKASFGERVNFVHVEVYPFPFGDSFQKQVRVPAMQEWNLLSEPWTFLVDANGLIQAKYEGGITLAELEPALDQLAAGQPIKPVVN
jgi:hypothetical protein